MTSSSGKPALIGGTPVVDHSQWPTWPPRLSGLTDALREVVEQDQWGVRSDTIRHFEETFAEYHDAKYALGMANGTLALVAALKALDIGPGMEVIIPAYTFMATAAAILFSGASPVFADIDAQTFNLDPLDATHRISTRTSAIVPVHVGGNPADIDGINELARKHDLAVIEDAAQAHAAVYNGNKVGALGDAGFISFQSSKNITSGEGGILLTNRREVYEQAFEIYNCGRTLTGPWYEHISGGLNMRMSAFQAAVLQCQMSHIEEWAELREANGSYLEGLLNSIPGINCARRYPGTTRNAYHLLIFTYDCRHFDDLPKSRFLEALSAEGVVATDGYRPLHRMPFIDQQDLELPITERVCHDGVWLRQFELLADTTMMDSIAEAVRKIQANAQQLHTTAR